MLILVTGVVARVGIVRALLNRSTGFPLGWMSDQWLAENRLAVHR
jgi:hypothetical protein